MRLPGRDGLDSPRTCTHGALGEDHERSDLRGGANVRPAAELSREPGNLDNAHPFAILLAEEHHRAKLSSLRDRRDECVHRQVLEHLLVHEVLDPLPLLVGELLRVCEVEPQLVGPHRRSGLADMVAEDLLQCLVQEVSRSVVRHRREADGPGHDRAHTVAGGEAFTLEQERLVVLETVGLAQLGARAAAVVALDPARVRDLSAAGRVEGRLPKLREEEAALDVVERTDLREYVRLLVADELGPEAGPLREFGCALVVLGDRAPRAGPLLLHQVSELLLVHTQAAFARELLRQLEREAVGIV